MLLAIEVYNSYHSMSLRVRNEIDYDFGLTYSLTATPDSKTLTKVGVAFLCFMPLVYFAVISQDISHFDLFIEKKIDIGLFVVGASLLLPHVQTDPEIRRKLMMGCLLPTVLGLIMVFL